MTNTAIATEKGLELVNAGLQRLPRVDAQEVLGKVALGIDQKLSSKQTNLVVAVVNKCAGRKLIRLEDLKSFTGIGKAEASFRGCLDPCDGATVGDLLRLAALAIGRA